MATEQQTPRVGEYWIITTRWSQMVVRVTEVTDKGYTGAIQHPRTSARDDFVPTGGAVLNMNFDTLTEKATKW